MYYSGIDLHKNMSVITTINPNGAIVKQSTVPNTDFAILYYFNPLGLQQKVVVESTSNWYWIRDLLETNHIELILAHAKYLKAISYAKVKTDKIDSHTLAQLLLEKFNLSIPDNRNLNDLSTLYLLSELPLSSLYNFYLNALTEQIRLLHKQINMLEKSLHPLLIPDNDVQRLLHVPGIGKVMAFNEAAFRAVQYYPEIKKYYQSLSSRKHKSIARTLVVKELAKICYHILKNKYDFNNKFKSIELSRIKSKQWPRLASPDA
jgi:transposase